MKIIVSSITVPAQTETFEDTANVEVENGFLFVKNREMKTVGIFPAHVYFAVVKESA